MNLGIYAKTFPGHEPLEIFTRIREAGFDAAHYNLECSGLPPMPDAIPTDLPAAVATAAAEAGLALAGLSGTYNMIHPDLDARHRGHQRLRVLAAACHSMGAPLISLCTGTRDPDNQWRHHPDNQTPEAWRDLLEAMTTALEIADEYDVELGIEPELANVVNSAAAARLLIAELGSPRLRVILDPANLFDVESLQRQRDIVAAAIDLLGARIAVGHAKDRRPDGAFTTAGQGVLDYAHFIRCLRSVDFTGPLIAHGLSAAEAPSVAGFLRTTMEAAS
jgi:sugar phosphate isomerase/epimerase